MAARKPKTEKQKLRDKADGLCRTLVRSRGYCQLAGADKVRCGGVLQWCHIIGRGNLRLRWEMWNALCMCAGHHVYYTHHPREWMEIVSEKFPEEWALVEANRNLLWDGDYERVIQELEDETARQLR